MTPIVHVGPEVALESSELVNGDEVFLIGFRPCQNTSRQNMHRFVQVPF